MKARKGAVLLQALIGITTVCCGALGYAGYSSIYQADLNTYITDQDAAQPSIHQEMVSYDTTNSDSGFFDAMPLLNIWTNAECSVTLQGNNIQIPFPQTLPEPKTICEGSMTKSSPMTSCTAEASFTFSPSPDVIQNSPTHETDELSIWAGQPEFSYSSDIEWGIVARIYDGNVYMFIQIGDGTRTLQFKQAPLHEVDGKIHTYSCALSNTRMEGIDSVVLQCTMDNNPPVLIDLTSSGLTIPTSYGLVAKSMRVSPPSTSIAASLLVTKLEYLP